jgi:PAS domain S-box-containing protein
MKSQSTHQNGHRSAIEAKLDLAEKAFSHSECNLRLTMQIWIHAPDDIEPLLARRADNSGEIVRLIEQLREQVDSEEELQLLEAASPRWSFSESYGELLRQVVDGRSETQSKAEAPDVLLPILLDHASWRAFVEFLRAQLEPVELTDKFKEKITGRARELVRQNQVLKTIVAERKRLQERVSQLASIIDGANDAIVVYTLGGTIASWNEGAEKLYGYAPKEVLGRSVRMLMDPDQPLDVAMVSEKLKRQERIRLCQAIHIRKGGKRMDVCMSVSPVKDVTGNLVGFAAITRESGNSNGALPPGR